MNASQKQLVASVILRVAKRASRKGRPCRVAMRMGLSALRMGQTGLFDEDEHPRDESGQFTTGGGSGKTAEDESGDEVESLSEWDEFTQEEREDTADGHAAEEEFERLPKDAQDDIIEALEKTIAKSPRELADDFDIGEIPQVKKSFDNALYRKDQKKYESQVSKLQDLMNTSNPLIQSGVVSFEAVESVAKRNQRDLEEAVFDRLFDIDEETFDKMVEMDESLSEMRDVFGDQDALDEDEVLQERLTQALLDSAAGREAADQMTEFGKSSRKLEHEDTETIFSMLQDGADARDIWDYNREQGFIDPDADTATKARVIKENPGFFARFIANDPERDGTGAWQDADIGKIPSVQKAARDAMENQ